MIVDVPKRYVIYKELTTLFASAQYLSLETDLYIFYDFLGCEILMCLKMNAITGKICVQQMHIKYIVFFFSF